jgi:hypothetical protein
MNPSGGGVRISKWLVLAAMAIFAAGMFASIMYKVAKYGP